MRFHSLTAAHDRLREEASELAGGLNDLAQRATLYRRIFRASQGNHVFPLIAAHGALWAGGQFRSGMTIGRWLALQYFWSAASRAHHLQQLADFFDTLRDINRRVCIDTYVQFHITRLFHRHPDISKFVPDGFLRPLCMVHEACDRRRPLTDS